MTVLVATTNPHKLREIQQILEGLPVALETLSTYPAVEVADEPGVTFAENARHKAVHYSRRTGRLTVAEDSGLEIAGLDGAPGVRSARYNGSTYPERFAAIKKALAERGLTSSDARFVCALAVAQGPEIRFEATGIIEGRLATAPHGVQGFGYDPIFFYPPFGCTLAEVPPSRKAEVSHRGQAFRQLRQFLDGGR